MQNNRIRGIMLLSICIAASIFLLNCGDNDDTKSEVIDGVHVVKGRKLVYVSDSTEGLLTNIFYDNNNRINKIVTAGWGNAISTLDIDYDDRAFRVRYDYNFNGKTETYEMIYNFALNSQGYISQIGNTKYIYDSDGFLINIEKKKDIWTFMYQNDDLVQFKDCFKASKDSLLYMLTYENNTSYYMVAPINKLKDKELWSLGIVAYHSGLFGRTTKHFQYLRESDSGTANFKEFNSRYETLFKLGFE